MDCTVIPGWCLSTRPGISRFRVRCFASPRNDGAWIASSLPPFLLRSPSFGGRGRSLSYRGQVAPRNDAVILSSGCFAALRARRSGSAGRVAARAAWGNANPSRVRARARCAARCVFRRPYPSCSICCTTTFCCRTTFSSRSRFRAPIVDRPKGRNSSQSVNWVQILLTSE